jgi:hypothetical protein
MITLLKSIIIISIVFSQQIIVSQWIKFPGFGNLSCNVITNCDTMLFAALDNGIYRSTNDGANWTLVRNSSARTIASNDSIIYINAVNGVYKSYNHGVSWIQTALTESFVWILVAEGSYVFAGTVNPSGSRGIYRSTNYGESWSFTSFNDEYVVSLAINGSSVYAGTGGSGGKVYVSSNSGENWNQTFFYSTNEIASLTAKDSIVLAGGGARVYISTNNGFNWAITSLSNYTPYSLNNNGANIFVGTNYGLYQSSNLGINWIQRNEGLENLNYQYINTICFSENYCFIGTFQYGIWRRDLKELISVVTISSDIPVKFSLTQNYPNPFNPVTNIKFEIPKSGFVKITIFDPLGREITTLVDQQMQPGSYSVDWDASHYPSGVYFCKIESSDYFESKKMVLVR